ncbi:hypothetical protein HBH98_241650 [Parastagonospora nodorum]|nr:hypothetical protein HBH51_238780 [Parastagonospora nodorum]KAH4334396.1 hypothetical protein HBH98_241650 [Parastagonospora nodorum]KAH4354351.1 hypothetical protein HBH97_250250 [Parastagonospora nodorum]KAH5052520.1 hypothetical protein HBI73_232900 [Parastagonospora nodorum]KAH5703676.1 hypothetical protein HBI20_245050 [Parastagonospora nodorum]
MAKWLENSINFAGYDEIRQDVIAYPDPWHIVPATLKILKVLIVELQSASSAPLDAAAELAEDEGSDDGG